MADKKITQLTDGGAPQATDEFVIARAGDNFKVDYAAVETEVRSDVVVDGDAAGGVLGGTYPNPGFAVDMATQAELDAHINDPTDAHDASAVSFVPTGNIAATDVQAAIVEAAAESSDQAVILAPASSTRNVIVPTVGTVIDLIVRAHAAQSVDIFDVQKSGGANQFRVGATGAIGIGDGGTYDPALYGGYLTHVVLSAATDGHYDAGGGAPFTPGSDLATVQMFIDGQLAPTVDLGSTTTSYGLGGSLRLTGTKNMGQVRGKFYEVIHYGTKPAGTGAQVVAMNGGYGTAFSDVTSTGDVTRMKGFTSFAEHAGSGRIITSMDGHVVDSYMSSTGAIPGAQRGIDVDTGVLALTGAALPSVTGIRVQTYSEGRAVTLMKGIDILNIGQIAGVVTSYGLYMAAQTGSTNVYGIYVAGGKSVFVDTLITGKIALPDDADFANGQGAWWWDQANSLPKWKGKTSGATVVNLTPYFVGGADVALADGGTGASLVDPNADRILFWDDSAGAVTWLTAGTNLTITGTTIDAAGSSGAPSTATYITQTPDAGLSAEQALSALATGIVKNTTTTGVLSIAAEGTDYYAPGGTDVAVADGGTGASTAATALSNLGGVAATIFAAKGDLLGASANDTPAIVTAGANETVLVADSAQASGLKYATRDRRYSAGTVTTPVDVTGTTTETNLISFTVAANDLGTTGVLRVTLIGDKLYNLGATDTIRLRAKFGGSTLIDIGPTAFGIQAVRTPWKIVLEVANLGVANSQWISWLWSTIDNSINTNTGIGAIYGDNAARRAAGVPSSVAAASAIDTTSNQTLALTAQLATTNALVSFRLQHAYAELLV